MINLNNKQGFAALLVVFLIMGVSFGAVVTILSLTAKEGKILRNAGHSQQSFYAAESGLEDAIYRIKNKKPYAASYEFRVGDATTTISISGLNEKTITSQGGLNNIFRTVRSVLTLNSVNPQFFYGVQAGEGGVEMDQNSRIEGKDGSAGNFYSNGPVEGKSGATITGDVIVATGLGSIDGLTVYGTVRVNSITDSKICADAYYRSALDIDSSSKNFLDSPSNPTCPDPLTPGTGYPNQPEPAISPLPISQANIDQWKADAGAGGVITGDYTVSSNVSLGPKEITGNLLMNSNNKVLTLNGTIYVRGNIDISNGSSIRCSSDYGSNSCVIVAGGWIHITNNGEFSGSGQIGSYLMLLTTLSGCTGEDDQTGCTHHRGGIDLHNNATGAVFYAQNSMVNLHNGVRVSEITAYKIRLDNNAIVRYEQGLINADFSSGPGASYKIKSWEEAE